MTLTPRREGQLFDSGDLHGKPWLPARYPASHDAGFHGC